MEVTAKKVFAAAKAAATYLPRNIEFFKKNQLETMKTLTVVNENIYALDYRYDYRLDALLEKGARSIGDILKFACKTIAFGAPVFSLENAMKGCSTFNAFNEKGEHIMGRNFDYKDAPVFVTWTHPVNGYASIGLTDANFMLYGDANKPLKLLNRFQTLLAPYVTVDGVNEKGLAIAVLEMRSKSTKQETGKTPITTTLMVRTVLDKAADIDEAIALFRQYDMHDSFFCNYHYMLSDAKGRTAVVEYVNNEMRVFYPENDNVMCCTNVFLSEDGDNMLPMGYDRLRYLDRRLKESKGRLSEDEAFDMLSHCRLEYRHHLGWDVTSLWSAVYNCTNPGVELAARAHFDRIYRFSVAEPLHFESRRR